MIFKPIEWLITFMIWLFDPRIATRKPLPKIDTEAPCPACGHTGSSLRCVVVQEDVLVCRTCGTCEARTYEKPVMCEYDKRNRAADVIHPAAVQS